MFTYFILFEWKIKIRRVSTWLYFLMFTFFTAFGVIMATKGHGFLYRITQAGAGQLHANAPFALHYLTTMLSSISVLVTCAFFATAGSRDFRYDTHELMFTLPVPKLHYLIGRFLGAFTLAACVFAGLPLGILLAHILPFADQDVMGPMRMAAIWLPYVTGVLPNVFLSGTVFFTAAALTRRQFPAYVAGLTLMLLNIAALILERSMLHLDWAALLDPFGQIASGRISGYWALAQKNGCLVPLRGLFLVNRAVWVIAGAALFLFLFRRFRTRIPVGPNRERTATAPGRAFPGQESTGAGSVRPDFSGTTFFLQIAQGARLELKNLLTGRAFRLVLFLGGALVFFTGMTSVGVVRGTPTWPLTGILLNSLESSLYLYNMVLVLFAAGQMVWRERQSAMHPVFDALPVPETVPLFSKLLALVGLQVLITAIVQVTCLIIQVSRSYPVFDWRIYLLDLWVIKFLYFVLIGVFVVFIQTLVTGKFIGYVLAVLFVDDFMPSVGLVHHLYRFARTPSFIHSEMNPLDGAFTAVFFYNVYWIAAAVVLVSITGLLWKRGDDLTLRARWRPAGERLTSRKKTVLICALPACLIAGGWVLYNTTAVNAFVTNKALNKRGVDYERRYKHWEKRAQPLIAAVDLNVALYPEKRRAEIEGEIVLYNYSDSTIRELQVQMPVRGDVKNISLSIPHHIDREDPVHRIHHIMMETPMMPGDSLLLRYCLVRQVRGFSDRRRDTRLVKNGTFLATRHLLPVIGYDRWKECASSRIRKKNGLPERKRLPPQSDRRARMETIVSGDSRRLRYHAELSTSADQTIITVGNQDSSWIDGQRYHAVFTAPGRILKYIPVISARFSVMRQNWQGISIEIYHHPDHTFNLDRMMKAARRSLALFTKRFGPYPFGSVRLVEFPRYELFAEAFPGLIPISEGYGFIAKHAPGRLEEIYRVVAHEIAHQWFAHQVIGGRVEGQFMLTESMAQYGAFLAVDEEFSSDLVAAYTANEMDRYFRGRGREVIEEVPLARTNLETWYLNYAKGFVVLRCLHKMIGSEAMKRSTLRFMQSHAFEEPPYAVSSDLISIFRDETPDSLQYLISDFFEKISFYSLKATAANTERLPDGCYKVLLQYTAAKMEADSVGDEETLPLHDYLPFAVYDEDGEMIGMKIQKVTRDSGSISLTVAGIPRRAGIDPEFWFLDKDRDDNIISIDPPPQPE